MTEPSADNKETPQSVAIPIDSKTHLAYLDGLRALAALYVFLYHARCQTLLPGKIQGLFELITYHVFAYGAEAVTLFIMLSGFCLMLPVLKNQCVLRGGALHFFKKRAKRIVPPYYFAIVFSIVLIYFFIGHKTGSEWDSSISVTTGGLITHILLVQDLFPRYQGEIDHPLWSISLEWRIYFLFPLIVYLWRTHGPVRSTLLVCAASLIITAVVGHFFNYRPSIQYVAIFDLGVLAAGLAYSNDAVLSAHRNRPWKLFTALFFIAFIYYEWTNPQKNAECTTLFALFGLCFLVAASKPVTSAGGRFLGSQALAFIGTFSYSIYLIHAPLLQMLVQYPLHALSERPMILFWVLALVGTPIIIAISYVFHRLFERPFMNTKPIREV